jgi:hypothetical protein
LSSTGQRAAWVPGVQPAGEADQQPRRPAAQRRRTSVVLSTQYEGRPVEAPPEDFLRASHSQGWR